MKLGRTHNPTHRDIGEAMDLASPIRRDREPGADQSLQTGDAGSMSGFSSELTNAGCTNSNLLVATARRHSLAPLVRSERFC